MAKSKRKMISFSERTEQMVNELMRFKGLFSFSSAVHTAIAESYMKTFPPHARNHNILPTQDKEVKYKIAKDNKDKVARNKCLTICNQLEGEVSVNEKTQTEYCGYYTHFLTKRYKQSVPLLQVTEDILKTQYQPSKEKVLQLQKEKKTDY